MSATQTRREGVPKPAADPVERRLEDAQGRAALELERVRRAARVGEATAADIKTARNTLSAAWAELDFHRACRVCRAKPTPEHWEAARLAGVALIKAHWGQPTRQAAKLQVTAALLEAQGIRV